MTKVVTSTEFQSKVLESDKVVLVDLFAEWCGPCKILAPIVEEVSQEVEGKYDIYKLNVDNDGDIAQHYGVMSIPTMIFFKNGKEVQRTVGVKEKDWILKELERLAGDEI